MRIVFIGAGRLAYSLAPALREAGHDIMQVYSRTLASAQSLATMVEAQPINDIRDVKGGADVYLFAVTDSSLPLLAQQLGTLLGQYEHQDACVFLHTAGSIDMSVFHTCTAHYGVIYPMQTFSKERRVELSEVPFFIEGNDDHAVRVSQTIAASVTGKVYALSSQARKHLHLAAVFACNFANHCYQLSAEILANYQIPFSVMLPLIDETAAKVHKLPPAQAQTGPAIRYDQGVMQAHLQMLGESPFQARIYELMSQSIHHSHENSLQND